MNGPRGNLVLALVIGIYLLLCTWVWSFTMDDAFISFRYAKHIADGVGPIWNLADKAEPVEGFTTFLYVWLLGGLRLATRGDPVLLGKIAGVAAMLLLAASVATAIRRQAVTATAALVGLSFLVLPFAALNSVSGMETSLFMLCNWLCTMAAVRAVENTAPGRSGGSFSSV